MKKQDRTHSRTAAEVERKYNLGQTFGSVSAQVADAKRAAASAEAAAQNLNVSLNQEGIVSRLTNSGLSPFIYIIEGEVFINASYIDSGVITSKDGEKVVIDLDNGTVSFADINTALIEMEERINTSISNLRQELVTKGLLEGEG